MTKFSGYVAVPPTTLKLLAEAANEHGTTIARHAELCIVAAMRIMDDRMARRIARYGEFHWRNLKDLHVNIPVRVIQDIGVRSIDAGMTFQAYVRSILIDAVDAMARPPVATRAPAAAQPMFRSYKPARIIVERQTRLGVPTFSMGDPPPGRSALDQKRAMEAAR